MLGRAITMAIALFLLPACSALQAAKFESGLNRQRAEVRAKIDEAACLAGGGSIRGQGMFGFPSCITPYSDGGKSCRDGADCEGLCIAAGDYPDVMQGDVVEGFCQSDNSWEGCYAEVSDGKSEGTICYD